MKVVNTVQEVRALVEAYKKAGKTVGFVPTMGYLHEGHKSLILKAKEECDEVVVSIFVNPTQFGPNEDLEAYPRDLEADKALCKDAGASFIFHPSVEEMYGENFTTYVTMDEVSKELCGKSRPIHFRGVCTVVCKLFNIVKPHKAYFGKKDAQQLAVIRRMVKNLNMDVEIVGCPIIREADGLAKSSRNTYLNQEERQAALCLSKAIFKGEEMVKSGIVDGDMILDTMKDIINQEPLARIDYVEMVSWDDCQINHTITGPVLVAIAVFVGKTRLIDNFIVE